MTADNRTVRDFGEQSTRFPDFSGYMRRVLGPMAWHQRMLTIYDQLNSATAKYYTKDEARALLEEAGFTDVRLHHRHGYSWTVIGARSEK